MTASWKAATKQHTGLDYRAAIAPQPLSKEQHT